MSARIRAPEVDAVLDRIDESDPVEWERLAAIDLADLCDRRAAWWERVGHHCYAVLESSGAFWVVYRGRSARNLWRFGAEDEACAHLDVILARARREVRP